MMQTQILLPKNSSQRKFINFIKNINFVNVLLKKINAGRIIEIKNIFNSADLKATDVVLDIGSGDGYWTNYFSNECLKIVGVEPYEEHLNMAQKNYSDCCVFTRGTAENLNFNSESFNKVISVCVFEHLINDEKAFSQIYRVLKNGGKLLATVDSLKSKYISESFRKQHMNSCYCSQLYTAESITGKLEEAGFKNITVKYIMGSRLSVFYETLSERIGPVSFFLLLPLYPIILFLENSGRNSGYKIFVTAEK